jgi:hypothetical protein
MAKVQKIPKDAKEAKNKDYSKVAMKPHSAKEKKKWVLIKPRKGKSSIVDAASAKATGPHTVCYYDPNTGFYDDCHESPV